MTVAELHDALRRMVEQGHGEVQVAVMNGNGQAKPLTGWELATSAGYDADRRMKKGIQFRLETRILF